MSAVLFPVTVAEKMVIGESNTQISMESCVPGALVFFVCFFLSRRLNRPPGIRLKLQQHTGQAWPRKATKVNCSPFELKAFICLNWDEYLISDRQENQNQKPLIRYFVAKLRQQLKLHPLVK